MFRLYSHEGLCCGCSQVKVLSARDGLNDLGLALQTIEASAATRGNFVFSKALRIPTTSLLVARNVAEVLRGKGWPYSVARRGRGPGGVVVTSPVTARAGIHQAQAPSQRNLPGRLARRGNTLYRFRSNADFSEDFEEMRQNNREAVLTTDQLTYCGDPLRRAGMAVFFAWRNRNTGRVCNWIVPTDSIVEIWRPQERHDG